MMINKLKSVTTIKQKPRMETYNSFNTKKRAATKIKIEQEVQKLINDVFCGKTMENVKNRKKLEFVSKSDYEQSHKKTSQMA